MKYKIFFERFLKSFNLEKFSKATNLSEKEPFPPDIRIYDFISTTDSDNLEWKPFILLKKETNKK